MREHSQRHAKVYAKTFSQMEKSGDKMHIIQSKMNPKAAHH